MKTKFREIQGPVTYFFIEMLKNTIIMFQCKRYLFSLNHHASTFIGRSLYVQRFPYSVTRFLFN